MGALLESKVVILGESDIGRAVLELFQQGVMIKKEECDVRDFEGLKKIFRSHSPSIIVNCAGVSNIQPLLQSDFAQWEEEISVNLVGSYSVARAAIEVVPDAHMIFFASVAGLYGKAAHSGYSASKAGVRSLVQSLGMEGHKAYAISPGRVDTKMREKDFPGEDPRTRLSTEQVAQVVVECANGKFRSGDNIVIRKRGFRTLRRIDRGQPWKDYLDVQPLGAPKLI